MQAIEQIKLRIYINILNKFKNTRNDFMRKFLVMPLLIYRIIRIYSLKIPFLCEIFVEKHLRISRKLMEKRNSYIQRVFIDVGAGDGFYSFYFAKKKYIVISFEPDIRNFSFIQRMNKIFRLENIKFFPYAIYNRNKSLLLNLSYMPYANISTIEFKKSKGNIVKVKSYTLDKIFRSIRISPSYTILVNMDVEGAEYKVFEGAKNFIKKFKPVFVFECQKNLDKIRKYLMKEGYKIYKVDNFNYISY
jgi:FkbM family methyltransferase